MLRFLDQEWLYVPRASYFEAGIGILPTQPRKVSWDMQFHYVASGPEWRRHPHSRRPHVTLNVHGMVVPPGDWRHLAKLNYWGAADGRDFLDPECFAPGSLDVTHVSGTYPHLKIAHYDMGFPDWRVARAEKSHFTIELAGGAHRGPLESPVLVPAGGAPGETGEDPPGFRNREVYLLETVAFGRVNMRVPRNARDPGAHAEAIAARLLKTPPADYIEVHDFKNSAGLDEDLFVKLHLHGYHQD